LLFTDADVLFKADAVRRALAYAECEKADHVVMFPRMIMKDAGEKMMIAFFQSLFVFGHRPWRVADPDTKDHMGVGAFNCIRRSVYEAIGTYKALRMEVIDDMKLDAIRRRGGRARMAACALRGGTGLHVPHLRWYGVPVSGASVLLLSASLQHRAVCLYDAALDVFDPPE